MSALCRSFFTYLAPQPGHWDSFRARQNCVCTYFLDCSFSRRYICGTKPKKVQKLPRQYIRENLMSGSSMRATIFSRKPWQLLVFFVILDGTQAFRSFPGPALHPTRKLRCALSGLRAAKASIGRRDLMLGAGYMASSALLLQPPLPAQAIGSSASLSESLGVLGYGGFPAEDPLDGVVTVLKRQLDKNYMPSRRIPPVRIPRRFRECEASTVSVVCAKENACVHVCVHVHMLAYRMCACMHTYILAHIHTCTHTYIHTSMHTCLRPYIHTYMHTYIHTYSVSYICGALNAFLLRSYR
jgi:hypothetical protein